MKTILLPFLLVVGLSLNAQVTFDTINHKQSTSHIKGWDTLTVDQQRRKMREINEIGINGREGYQTKFTDMDMNFVNARVEKLMHGMNLYQRGEAKMSTPGTFTFDFMKLKVSYHVVNDKDYTPVVTKADITGDVWAALKFFVFFWNTTLKFEDLKENEVVYVNYFDERIGFKLLPGGATAAISIRSAKPISSAPPAQH